MEYLDSPQSLKFKEKKILKISTIVRFATNIIEEWGKQKMKAATLSILILIVKTQFNKF